MLVEDAKDAARQWMMAEADRIAGFDGAFFHGATNWLPDDAVLPASSDLDVMVVVDGPDPPVRPGKFVYRDVLLEVSYLPSDQLRSAEVILGNYRLAGSFRRPSIIVDPSGRLTRLGAAVAKDYPKRRWVTARRDDAERNVRRHLRSLNEADPFHDQVTSWLFGTGVTTHVLLVAGSRNPTVRRRYAAVRELLKDFARLDFHEPLLAWLGCDGMSRDRVEHHLAVLTEVFDAATAVVETPLFFASDISEVARPIAIDGSWELIERGLHREAVFWIVATYARCLKVLFHDAPAEMRERFAPGFRDLVGDLGVASFDDLRRRGAGVAGMLPRLREVADAIIAANRDIDD